MEFFSSDQKRLLSLPFQNARLVEFPEPKRGQKEWEFFTEIYGYEWDKFKDRVLDDEEKITEFNYEQHLPSHILKSLDTQNSEFKRFVKVFNFSNPTEIEQHKINQEQFK